MEDIRSIEVRRLNSDELTNINSIQAEAKDLLAFYNDSEHKTWLKRAMKDVKDGIKVALGAFLKNGKDSFFVGSAILKRGTRQNQVELKNFIIAERILSQNSTILQDSKAIFLKSIEQFCSVRGFSNIGIEFPADLTSQISFFLVKEYRVSDARKSRYRHEDYHYFLEKKLGKTYTGDPFDRFAMARWMIHEFMQFPRNLRDEVRQACSEDGDFIKNSFVFRVNDTENESCGIDLFGACLFDVDDNFCELDDVKKFSKLNYDLKLYITTKKIEKKEKYEKEVGLKAIDFDLIKKSLGEKSSFNLVRIDPSNIGGLIVVVGSNFIDRICAQKKNFVYVVKSGIGHFINVSEKAEESKLLIVFCAEEIQSSGNIDIKIWGYSSIVNFNMVSMDSIEDTINDDLGVIWTKQEQDYYLRDEFNVNYNENSRVSLVELTPPKILNNPKSVYDSSVVSEDVSTYIYECSKYGVSAAYIDKDTLIQIMKTDYKYSDLSIYQDEKMIESLIESINLVGSLVGASSDTYSKIQNLINNLKLADDPLDVSSSRVEGILSVISKELDSSIDEYKNISNVKGYSDIDKDSKLVLIFEKTLKLLEAAESLKSDIPDYNILVAFFTDYINKYSIKNESH